MEDQRNPQDESIIGRDARQPQDLQPEAGRDAAEQDEAGRQTPRQGDLEVEFESEIPDDGEA